MSEEPKPRACAWCGATFRPGTIGRAAVYCRRSCRQRAYEARREAQRIEYALAMAAADSSRDERPGRSDSTRDETESGQPPAPTLPDPRDGWVRSPDEVEAQLRELEARRAAPPAPRVRRRLAAPADPTLFEPEGDSAGGSRGGASGTANDTHPGHGETGTDTE
ncbi:MAG: hypothetical protein HOY69_09415 [Streptomyces sp.]|nr:hypothetical protein [Streptomyces sp.]